MAKNGRNEAEEIIVQAIGHSDRRSILRIIGATQDGVTYSSILGETEMNTGHLNYHLRNLEGLIEKQDGVYKLTPLGYRALDLVNNMLGELDVEVIPYIEAAKGRQESSIHPFIKGLLYIGIAGVGLVFLSSIALFVISITQGGLSGIFISIGMAAFTGVVLWVFINALKTVPAFVRRLERKLMDDQ
jgi:hypothetical protein